MSAAKRAIPIKILILGAGISGLSTAYFLQKTFGPKVSIQIVDKAASCGGWIKSESIGAGLFEAGPRSFRTASLLPATIELIQDLKLETEMVGASDLAASRAVYYDKKLHQLPKKLWQLPFAPMTKGVFKALLKDLVTPFDRLNDQSIYNFFCARFGHELTQKLVDPLVSGIFAGNMHELSMRSCFPAVWRSSQKHGSVLLGKIFGRQNRFINPYFERYPSSFTFKQGMEQLVNTLKQRVMAAIFLNQKVVKVALSQAKVSVETADQNFSADLLISTIPTFELASLISKEHPYISQKLLKVPYSSLALAQLTLAKDTNLPNIYGYLVNSCAQEPVLGTVFDSNVFPGNYHPSSKVVTVMMGGMHSPEVGFFQADKLTEIAISSLARHLKMQIKPLSNRLIYAQNSIPQFLVGHYELTTELKNEIKRLKLPLLLSGAAFSGVSVNEAIQGAFDTNIDFFH